MIAADLVEELYDVLLAWSIASTAWSVHRAASMGTSQMDRESETRGGQSSMHDMDVFGQSITHLGKLIRCQECVCPSCGRSIAASRFAPHLEKCMGMGRNSSRIAKRRLAAQSRLITPRTCDAVIGGVAIAAVDSDMGSDEDSRMALLEEDEDWLSSKKTGTRNNGTRRPKFRSKRRKVNGGSGEMKTTDDWGVLETDDSLPSLLGDDALPPLMMLRNRK